MSSLETVVARAKRKGFVYPNSEIYGGLANARDYGPYGSLLKKNIADAWTRHFTQSRSDIVLMDTSIIAHPTTWLASGHLAGFADALIDDKKTGQRFRADKIIEEWIEKEITREKKNLTERTKDTLRPPQQVIEGYNELPKTKEEFIDKEVHKQLLLNISGKYHFTNLSPESWGNEGIYAFITGEKIKNPSTGKEADRTEVRQFNLMLDTHLGPVADAANQVYLRPETCQSLFTNFRNICDTTRSRIPFGLAQIGKAFRNEITPGQFLYRTREFEQMEIEYFVPADDTISSQIFDQWKADSLTYWTEVIGISPNHLKFHDHEKLAHYAKFATDVEYLFPRGFGEVQGIHHRGDFDLTQHAEHAKANMQYTDPKTGDRYIPRCIEASWGLGRQVMVAMLEFYDEEIIPKEDGTHDTRIVVRFPFNLAPVKYAILPLLEKNDAMVQLGQTLLSHLQSQYKCELDVSGNIGKRYRRQDEIGTPYCICIDHQSLEDGTVTIRDRDTMTQTRIAWTEIKEMRKSDESSNSNNV